MIIPDGISLLGILIALHLQYNDGNILQALLGIDMGIGVMWIMNCLKLQRVGGGDAKLMALIGVFTNWQVALCTALIALLIYLPFKYRLKQKTVAYSPYIVGGLVVCLIGRLFLRI